MHAPMDDLAARFTAGFEELAGMLDGRDPRGLADDPAIRACREHPVPMLSAAMGITAVRRAARLGAGLLFDSLSTPERCRELTDAYRDAGGTAPCVIIRRAWVGEPPRERVDDQIDVYRSYSSSAAQQHWGGNELVDSPTPESVVAGLVDAIRRAGADACNLRVHVPGVDPQAARAQIAALGDEVLPRLRAAMAEMVAT
jgi:alkanesulfonate monooxygenase SsuD/methylene tetrahydromethanopterin reductase-like flavin-dependent oxidoreductase (luciferase family)